MHKDVSENFKNGKMRKAQEYANKDNYFRG